MTSQAGYLCRFRWDSVVKHRHTEPRSSCLSPSIQRQLPCLLSVLSGCCSEKMQVYCSFLLPLPDPNICLADLMVSKLVLSSYFSSDDSPLSCPATGEKLADEICMAQCAQVSKTANFSSEFTLAQTGFKI